MKTPADHFRPAQISVEFISDAPREVPLRTQKPLKKIPPVMPFFLLPADLEILRAQAAERLPAWLAETRPLRAEENPIVERNFNFRDAFASGIQTKK